MASETPFNDVLRRVIAKAPTQHTIATALGMTENGLSRLKREGSELHETAVRRYHLLVELDRTL